MRNSSSTVVSLTWLACGAVVTGMLAGAAPATRPAAAPSPSVTVEELPMPADANVVGEVRPVAAKKIRVALYADSGSKSGGDNVEKALALEPTGFVMKRVTAEDVRAGVLKDFDVFVAGGGSGSKIAEALQPEGREAVKKFVKSGGGYLGICAGAYLASSDYAWSLHLLNAKVIDKKHWARGGGEVTLKLSPEGKDLLGKGGDDLVCVYNQGPLLSPGEDAGLSPYTPLALFGSEIAKKGAPSGVMVGATAMARGQFGEGRVVAISPHPEKWLKHNEVIRRVVAFVGKASATTPTPTTQANP